MCVTVVKLLLGIAVLKGQLGQYHHSLNVVNLFLSSTCLEVALTDQYNKSCMHLCLHKLSNTEHPQITLFSGHHGIMSWKVENVDTAETLDIDSSDSQLHVES